MSGETRRPIASQSSVKTKEPGYREAGPSTSADEYHVSYRKEIITEWHISNIARSVSRNDSVERRSGWID